MEKYIKDIVYWRKLLEKVHILGEMHLKMNIIRRNCIQNAYISADFFYVTKKRAEPDTQSYDRKMKCTGEQNV